MDLISTDYCRLWSHNISQQHIRHFWRSDWIPSQTMPNNAISCRKIVKMALANGRQVWPENMPHRISNATILRSRKSRPADQHTWAYPAHSLSRDTLWWTKQSQIINLSRLLCSGEGCHNAVITEISHCVDCQTFFNRSFTTEHR